MATPVEPNPQRWNPSADPTSIVVPGLDSNAPINDQIDQIEQLITIKLQNIDANFSKIQHLMATRLLPAVKRYAVGTEPVREAAKFWTSFYEQAAQVHIPTLDDYNSVNDEQTQPSVAPSPSVTQTEDDLDVTPSRTMTSQTNTRTYDVTASESSFMPSNAVSSTPARPGHSGDRTVDEQPSWSASLESPMVRLNRELQSFARETEEEVSVRQDVSNVSDKFAYEEEDTIQQSQLISQTKVGKGPSRVDREPAKANVEPSLPRSAMPTPRATSTYISPLKVKPKTPIAIPKHLQSYLPPKLDHEPVFASPRRPRYERSPRKPAPPSSSTSASTSRSASRSSSVLDIPSFAQHTSDSNPGPKFTEFNDSFDDSVDLMQGMSPPRTLAFAKAPRSSVGLGLLPPLGRTPGRDLMPTLGRTPGKEAADRIRRDLLGDMQSQFGSANTSAANRRTPAFGYGAGAAKDDTMSTIPTPPSLSRYTRHAHPSWTDSNDTDTSLATMMRRVGLDVPESSFKSGSVASTSHSRSESRGDITSDTLAPPLREDELHTPDHQTMDIFDFHQDEQSVIQPGLDSHPHRTSDSDSDSDSDSLNDEPAHLGQPSTAFLMASNRDADPDDSFGSSNSNHSSDSLGVDDFAGGNEAAVHPFARALEGGAGDGFDDSFESDGGFDAGQGDESVIEDTVFGIPPAQRGGQGLRGQGQLRLLGEDLLQDTIGIGGQLAKVGRIEESPTPYGRG